MKTFANKNSIQEKTEVSGKNATQLKDNRPKSVLQQKQVEALAEKNPAQRKVNINDDTGLEKEADVMGEKAVQFKPVSQPGAEGVDYSVMSSQQYSNWQGTVQGKFAQHHATHSGDRVAVAQLQQSYDVLQRAGFLSGAWKGGLIITEGILSIVSGGASIALSGGTGIVPGAMSVGIGAVKVGRGILTICAGDKPSGKWLAALDILRGIESIVSIISGALTENLPVLIFGIAKLVRSLITAITDAMGNETEHYYVRKGLMILATGCHYLEVAAGTWAGAKSIEKGISSEGMDEHLQKTIGSANVVISGSKTVRATDQGKAALTYEPSNETQPLVPDMEKGLLKEEK